MNILQISAGREKIPVIKGGGIENVIFNISKNMAKNGNNVTILDRKHLETDADLEYLDKIKIKRLSTIQLKFNKKLYFVSTILNELIFSLYINRYIKKIKKNKKGFDIIHFHDPFLGSILILLNRELRKNMFYTTHQPLWSLEKPSFMLRLIYMNFEKFIMANANCTNVPNDFLKSKIEKITKGRNIITIPNGIDIDVFSPNNDIGNIKEKYNMEKSVNILFVGRFHWTKGIEYLVRAINIIINKYGLYHVQFVLVGPFGKNDVTVPVSDNRKIFTLIEEYGIEKYIKMTGAIPFEDLKKLYTACDICVVPSLAEMYALVTLEAMSAGKPVVATNIAGPCVKNGFNGFIVESANEVQLAEKIGFLIENYEERERMGRNGRLLAENEFSWKNIADKYLKAYEEYNHN